jgi:hypothetical protein
MNLLLARPSLQHKMSLSVQKPDPIRLAVFSLAVEILDMPLRKYVKQHQNVNRMATYPNHSDPLCDSFVI